MANLKPKGFQLVYGRREGHLGYYAHRQSALSPDIKQMLRCSVDEIDQRQIEIYQRLPPADRFRQGCAISDTARNVVAYRIRQENPNLSPEEANRIALQRAYHS